MTILLATNNPHKVDEMTAILQQRDADVHVVTMKDLELTEFEVDETGLTLEENAYLKARAFFEASGVACIADDTGLEISALDGKPGVHTARFAGPNATSSDNIALALESLRTANSNDRSARFRTVMCYVDAARTLFAEGVCEGQIANDVRGATGFGYDPIFIPAGYTSTFAELDAATKNSISHRGLALRACADMIHALHSEKSEPSDVENDRDRDLAHIIPHAALKSLLCRAAAAAALNQQSVVAECCAAFVENEHDPQLLYETLLQSYLFAGFPAALESLTTMSTTLQTLGIEWSAEDDEEYNLRRFYARGTQTIQQIYSSVTTTMREKLSVISPHLESWMVIEGYGKTLSRPQLDLQTRELINVAILAACGWERQLYSHLRGAKNVGASNEECELALNSVMSLTGSEVFSRALEVWNRLQAAQQVGS